MSRTWSIAGTARGVELSTEDLSSAYREVERRIRPNFKSRRLVVVQAASLIAALVVGLIVGHFISQPKEAKMDVLHSNFSGTQYLILIRNDSPPVGPKLEKDIVREYRNWARKLADEGHLIDAAELRRDGSIIFATDHEVGTKDLSMNRESATGYFLVRVSNRAEAEDIARNCPQLEHGGSVELREIIR